MSHSPTTPGLRWALRELRRHASWTRLLIRHGSELSGLPSLLVEDDGELGNAIRLGIEAEELAAYIDWVVAEVESGDPPRLDLAVRLRDLLEVRRPARKAHLAPVEGIVSLTEHGDYVRLGLRVSYMEELAFPVVLTADDRSLVEDGQRVTAGALMSEGEVYLADLLQVSGPEGVLQAFSVHLETIARHLGCSSTPHLPSALQFVRNWMLSWVCVQDPGALALPAGTVLPYVLVASLVSELEPGMPRPRLRRQIMGLASLAERYLGHLS